jgi:bacterioferritin
METHDGPFMTDIQEIRRRAREHIESGAVTSTYRGDKQAVIALLNDALATEIVCVLRYSRHYYMAQGLSSEAVKAEFLQHAREEQAHADQLAERIVQLGGEPDLNPAGFLPRSHSEYREGSSLVDMVREDLIAERIAIDSYREIVRFLGEKDPTSRRLMEAILEKEEEHAEDMLALLQRVDIAGVPTVLTPASELQ